MLCAFHKVPQAGNVNRRRNPPAILCECPGLVKHKIEILSSVRLELTDLRRATVKSVLVLIARVL
jgi:hypothetical protein